MAAANEKRKLPKGMMLRGKVYYSCIAGVDGRMHRARLSENFDTAKAILANMRRDVDLQRAGVIEVALVKKAHNLEEIRQGYVKHMLSGVASENTVTTFGIGWAQVIHKNNIVYLTDLVLSKIESWAKKRLEEGTRGQTINLYVGHVFRALQWAVNAQLLRSNPLACWRPVRNNESLPRRDLSMDEIDAMLRVEDSLEWRTRWLVYVLTGLRKTAGANILWEWLDWDAKMLHIPTEHNKSRKPLDIPVHGVFYDALKAWHEKRNCPAEGPAFPTVRGIQVNRRLTRVCELAGVDPTGVTPHSFRHTFATMIYEGTGKDIKAVQELLGHASATTTMRYLHLSNDDKRAAIETLAIATNLN